MSGFASPALTPAQASAILAEVANRLTLVLTSPQHVEPGKLVTASLLPASSQLDASDLVNGFLNLAWTAKDVLFGNTAVANLPAAGDLQGDSLATGVTGLTEIPFPPPLTGALGDTAGVLGQLFGGVALPNLKIRVRLRWRLFAQDGTELEEGRDFLSESGLASPDVILAIPPIFRELRFDTLQNAIGEVVCLRADVELAIGDVVHPFQTPGVPVLLLPLFVPTVVALFSEHNFDVTHESAVLLMVPEHSPLSSAEPLIQILRRIETALDRVRSIAKVATWLLGVSDFLASVPQQPRIRFVAANGIERLGSVRIKRRPWYAVLSGDRTFDDEVNSLMILGIPGTRRRPGTSVEFFNDTHFKKRTDSGSSPKAPPGHGQGWFRVQLMPLESLLVGAPPEFFVAIRSLDQPSNDRPVTVPPDPLALLNPGQGHVPEFEPDMSSGNDGRWHTDMSSVRFAQSWLDLIKAESALERPEQPPLTCAGQTPIPIAPTGRGRGGRGGGGGRAKRPARKRG